MKVNLLDGGLVRIPARLLKQFRLTVDSLFGLIAPHQRLMWLVHEPERFSFNADLSKLKLTGYVESIGVADMFSTFNMSQRTGALAFLMDDVEKTVFFEKGEILFATSNAQNDRLGNVLLHLGKLTAGQLREAEGTLTPGTRFGHHLVQKGFLAEKEIYTVIKHQVEEILFSLFTVTEGVFLFFEDAGVEEDLVQFTLNTQNILMEGFQRVDEWKLIKKKITTEKVIPKRLDKEQPEQLPVIMQQVLAEVDDVRNIDQIGKQISRGDFVVYKALFDLEKAGLVQFETPKPKVQNSSTAENLISDFNKLFRTVAREVKDAGESNLDRSFNAFVNNLPRAVKDVLIGVPVKDDGGLDELVLVTKIRESVRKKGAMSALVGVGDILEVQAALSALNESLNFYLMTAKKVMPVQKAERLIAAIRNVRNNIVERYKT